jgi:hypothetical protein
MEVMELPGIRLSWERPVMGTVLQAVISRSAVAVKKWWVFI